jgi:hypothetical protein
MEKLIAAIQKTLAADLDLNYPFTLTEFKCETLVVTIQERIDQR